MNESKGQVVLLHGLARSANSMKPLERYLQGLGYQTCNVPYPSRHYTVEKIASDFVLPFIRASFPDTGQAVNFVTHSLGGIVVRQLAATKADIKIGRVVMLAPPNHGSEVVNVLGRLGLFRALNGPAGLQLGTAQTSLPNLLGPASFEAGIVASDFSINPLLSSMIAGANDGRVSVESAKLEGMADFIVVSASHPFIMKNRKVWGQIARFLEYGKFE